MQTHQQLIDERFMDRALELARQAGSVNEVPVGALVVLEGQIVASAGNRCVSEHDPCAHAEVLALREAARTLQTCRLDKATLYVTLEPCLMCCGALLQSRIARLVYGAREPKTGAVVSVHESLRLQGVSHHVAITEGVHAAQSTELLQSFFRLRR